MNDPKPKQPPHSVRTPLGLALMLLWPALLGAPVAWRGGLNGPPAGGGGSYAETYIAGAFAGDLTAAGYAATAVCGAAIGGLILPARPLARVAAAAAAGAFALVICGASGAFLAIAFDLLRIDLRWNP